MNAGDGEGPVTLNFIGEWEMGTTCAYPGCSLAGYFGSAATPGHIGVMHCDEHTDWAIEESRRRGGPVPTPEDLARSKLHADLPVIVRGRGSRRKTK
jgi:hypothetical protein|nr:hypothetical protein [uncultured Dongia sp.]